MPTAAEEKTMVLLCVSQEERNPDPRRAAKYPAVINRKNNPAWLWLMPKSFSIVGSRGDRMIRDEKFMKKIDAKNRTGTTYGQKGPSFVFWLLSAALREIKFLFNVYLPLLPIPIFTFIEKYNAL